jgi:cold shock CspA family protein
VGGGADQARRLRRGTRVRYDVTMTAQGPQVSALWIDEAPRRPSE